MNNIQMLWYLKTNTAIANKLRMNNGLCKSPLAMPVPTAFPVPSDNPVPSASWPAALDFPKKHRFCLIYKLQSSPRTCWSFFFWGRAGIAGYRLPCVMD